MDGLVFGITWDDRKRGSNVSRQVVIGWAALLMAVPSLQIGTQVAKHWFGGPTDVVVRATSPAAAQHLAQDVADAGGRVVRTLGIINSVEAQVPSDATGFLRSNPDVASVSPNGRLHLLATSWDPTTDAGSIYNTTSLSGAQSYWGAGYTGRGVDVALIDSGVVPVNGLTATGKVINGPDLSLESQFASAQYLDSFGHGTHMAGIISGRDDATVQPYKGDSADFVGMAPDSRVLNVKVSDAHGYTDVSEVIAAIDWVVQHKNDNGMNVRVLNLSFGTDGSQSYAYDPLAYAAEVAWHNGIVVVTAAGNAGFAPSGSLADPAYDPYLVAVGAADTQGTTSPADDTVASFSQTGVQRKPDLVAPGVHVVSLRDPGSYVDQTFGTTGLVGTRFFRGSGTSQATAVVSGAAALLLSQRPSLTPDQVKFLLTSSATKLNNQSANAQGNGELNLNAALTLPVPSTSQSYTRSMGTGTLEGSRGSQHLVMDGVVLQGEKDIFGAAFNSTVMAAAEGLGSSWSGGMWNGSSWSGSSWSGSSWSGSSWSGSSWSGSSWSGSSWSGSSWSGSSWSGSSWSGSSWSGSSWSGSSWSGSSWSGSSWSGSSWSGSSWSGADWI